MLREVHGDPHPGLCPQAGGAATPTVPPNVHGLFAVCSHVFLFCSRFVPVVPSRGEQKVIKARTLPLLLRKLHHAVTEASACRIVSTSMTHVSFTIL